MLYFFAMGIFRKKDRASSVSASPRIWGGGAAALERSSFLRDPLAMQALEAYCSDGETITGVVDGTRMRWSSMEQTDAAIVVTDRVVVAVEGVGKKAQAEALAISSIREIGFRLGFVELVIGSGPPSDFTTWLLRVGPEEHLRPFASLIATSPYYTGDK